MPDIILAECNGNGWLVRGEEHIDDLLNNTLPPDVSIEVISCESKTAVDALWFAHGGDGDTSNIWMIHPAIVRRSRGLAGQIVLLFGAWSASLEAGTKGAVESAAGGARLRPNDVVALIRYIAADALPMATDLANLRTAMVEALLAEHGVEAGRIVRLTQPVEEEGQADRIDVVLRPA